MPMTDWSVSTISACRLARSSFITMACANRVNVSYASCRLGKNALLTADLKAGLEHHVQGRENDSREREQQRERARRGIVQCVAQEHDKERKRQERQIDGAPRHEESGIQEPVPENRDCDDGCQQKDGNISKGIDFIAERRKEIDRACIGNDKGRQKEFDLLTLNGSRDGAIRVDVVGKGHGHIREEDDEKWRAGRSPLREVSPPKSMDACDKVFTEEDGPSHERRECIAYPYRTATLELEKLG